MIEFMDKTSVNNIIEKFTKEHYQELKELLVDALLNSTTVVGNLGMSYNVYDLLHNTTLNTLRRLKEDLTKEILRLKMNLDSWDSDTTRTLLEKAEKQVHLIYLIIGYKMYKVETERMLKEKQILQEKLESIKESHKSEDEKITELQLKIKEIENACNFQ